MEHFGRPGRLFPDDALQHRAGQLLSGVLFNLEDRVAPEPYLLETQALTQAYGPKTVLHGLDLRLRPGAIGLLGPNGSGKSTLLRTLLGLLPLAGGTARVFDLDVATQDLAIRRRIGLMPESECMVPGMNAVELTAYCGELVGMARRDAIERAHQVLYYVGLGESRYRDLGGYSQGMKQRLKLAQALVHDPDLLLLDEPTAGMDPPGREAMLELIRDISGNKGVSVIISTHLLPDVEETCGWVVVLKDGRLVEERSVQRELIDRGVVFDLRGRGDLAGLAEKLKAQGHLAELVDETLRVMLQRQEGTRPVFEALAEMGESVQIRHLTEASRGIEDQFNKAIR
jgi:ABC-2 type transport system ATP-binding protein